MVDLLLDHVLHQLNGKHLVEAFSFATALGLGLEALPVRHRPVTRAALIDRGFAGEDMWRQLPAPGLPHTDDMRVEADNDERKLEIRQDDQLLAEATIGVPIAGIGVLWWIHVEPAARGKGLGRALLGSALDMLTGLVADQVILYVDDDANPDDPERGRGTANALYDSAGCIEVDLLHSFQLRR